MSDHTFKERATIAAAVKLGCLSPEDAAALRAERDAWREKAEMIWQTYITAFGKTYTESLAQHDSEVATRAVDKLQNDILNQSSWNFNNSVFYRASDIESALNNHLAQLSAGKS